jgi:glutathione peroxidase
MSKNHLRTLLTTVSIILFVFFSPIIATAKPNVSIPSKELPCPEVLNHAAAPLLSDKTESLCKFAGKTVLIVNTASQCGFTGQYDGLEKLYKKYASKGLVVVGFPANDFGAQEKGNNQQIAQFCKLNFGVSFPMYQKLSQPIHQTPLFAALSKASNNKPQWNFHKYLISPSGRVSGFESAIEPESKLLVSAIETHLRESAR